MTLPTHFMLGMIIGKITGNYPVALASSTLIDLDHLQSYATHGVLFKPKKLWRALTEQKDEWGDQRGIFHNVIFFAAVSVLLILLLHEIGILIVVGYFGHLCLDVLDNSDYWPLYPNKSVNLRGPIKYGTWQELIFFLVLLVIYIFI